MNYYIGIDVGGTAIKGGIINEDGQVLTNSGLATEADKGPDVVVRNIAALVDKMLSAVGIRIAETKGIGMGVPGMVNVKKGIALFAANLGFVNYPIVEKLRAYYPSTEIQLTNDANAAALGESLYGAAKDYNTGAVMVTLGTGVGGGIVIRNALFAGNRAAGAEIGHMVIRKGGEPCTCGRRGCFEAYCSATALIRDTKRAMDKHPESKLWEIGGKDFVTGQTAFDYKDSDKVAAAVVKNYLKFLSCGLANLANVFRPEVIILGGGICNQGDDLIKPLQRMLNKELFGGRLGPMVKIVVAELGNRAGFMGAASLNLESAHIL